MKRGTSLLLAGLGVIAITAAVLGVRSIDRVTTVRGVIGSEKQGFFADPQVVKEFERHGLKVDVDPVGSRQIANAADLRRYDFAFPGGAPAAEKIQRQRHILTKYQPFSSPIAIATFQPIAELLARSGVARKGDDGRWTFDVARYLDMVSKGVRWDQLEDNSAYRVRRNVLVSTTDPRNSNSAGMYLAIASYVANDDTIVQGAAAEAKVLPVVTRLFLDQGYTENTTEGPFEDYLSIGMGKTPLVCVYEAQFVERYVRGQIKPGMVLMYPSPTVVSKHTLVPLDDKGDKVGRLLVQDPELQRLAARHGLRTADPDQFAKVVAAYKVPVSDNLIDLAEPPSYETLEHLLDGVAKSYG